MGEWGWESWGKNFLDAEYDTKMRMRDKLTYVYIAQFQPWETRKVKTFITSSAIKQLFQLHRSYIILQDFQKRWESKYMYVMDPGLFDAEQLRIPTKHLSRNLKHIRACNFTVQFPTATEW